MEAPAKPKPAPIEVGLPPLDELPGELRSLVGSGAGATLYMPPDYARQLAWAVEAGLDLDALRKMSAEAEARLQEARRLRWAIWVGAAMYAAVAAIWLASGPLGWGP